jgi:hypothetical protein
LGFEGNCVKVFLIVGNRVPIFIINRGHTRIDADSSLMLTHVTARNVLPDGQYFFGPSQSARNKVSVRRRRSAVKGLI